MMASEQVIEKVAAAVFDVIHPNAAGAYANFKGDLEYMDVARAAVAAYEEAREGERGMVDATASPSAVTSGSGGEPGPGTDEGEFEFGNEPVIWICQRAGDYFPHPSCPFDCDCTPVRYIRATTSHPQAEARAEAPNDPQASLPPAFAAVVNALSKEFAGEFPKRWVEAFERGQREGGLLQTQPNPSVVGQGEEARVEAARVEELRAAHESWVNDPDADPDLSDALDFAVAGLLESVSHGVVRDGQVVVDRADLDAVTRWLVNPGDAYSSSPEMRRAIRRLRAALSEEGDEGR